MSSFSCVLFHRYRIIEITEEFKAFDCWIHEKFELQLNYLELNKSFQKTFITMYLISISGCAVFVTSSYFNGFSFIDYACQLSLFTHLVHLQLLQLLTFFRGIQNRLELLTNVELLNSLEKACNLKKALLKLFDINKKLNESFRLSIFFNLMELYSSILINFYWMGLSVLGISFVVLIDGSSFVIPCFSSLFLLAQAHRRTEKALKQIYSKTTNSCEFSHQTEELLVLQSHCKFFVTTFGLLDTSFATIGSVSFRF
jgi:hypothetical protein